MLFILYMVEMWRRVSSWKPIVGHLRLGSGFCEAFLCPLAGDASFFVVKIFGLLHVRGNVSNYLRLELRVVLSRFNHARYRVTKPKLT